MTYALSYSHPEQAIDAVRKLRESHPQLERIDVHSPYHLPELDDLLPVRAYRVSGLVFGCALLGASSAYLFQCLAAIKLYPFQIGGTPLYAWPAFLPVTFEFGVLLAAFAAVFGTILMCGLPRFYNPVFDIPGFERASVDRFILVVSGGPEIEATLRDELGSMGEGKLYVG